MPGRRFSLPLYACLKVQAVNSPRLLLPRLELPLLWILQAGVMERKLFTIPSFKIYGGVAGFFDFGPPGCAVKQNITQLWRQHFILEENMLEVEAKP